MLLFGQSCRTIWIDEKDPSVIRIIDQRHLPYQLVIEDLRCAAAVVTAIKEMHVRGAGLIGATAAYGLYLSALTAPRRSVTAFMQAVIADSQALLAARPTAVNLQWAIGRSLQKIRSAGTVTEKIAASRSEADAIADFDVACCRSIGLHGVPIIEELSCRKQGRPVNILTHCNAGWLAFVDYGTATAPIYVARERGIAVHVYVDETRPLNQGSKLTAFELHQNGIPHTVVPDNAGGHLMQHGLIDLVLVGSDRTTRTGDVANKIGTYLKAVAAHAQGIPFYVALPTATIDWNLRDGIREIPIEERSQDEVKYMTGLTAAGQLEQVLVSNADSPAVNYAFDVTPARFITALITEMGVCPASEEGLRHLMESHH